VKIAIDPITRIEGHLRIEAEIDGGKVTDVWSSTPSYRGIETILTGRDPRDAWVFTQRICGVCTTVSAIASVRAVENALSITIPNNARILRNLMEAAQYTHDHVVHFYHLHGPDWIDVTAALSANPGRTSALQKSMSAWPKNSEAHFTEVKDRLATFVNSGQLGLFGGGYWGHPAYQLTPEESLLLMAHYLEALDWQREAVKIHAYLGGKNPHPQTYVVGGMATPLDPTSPTAINLNTLASLRGVAETIATFVDQVYVPDLLLLGKAYASWAGIGEGPGNLLCVGDFPDSAGKALMPAGIIRGKDLTRVLPVDQAQITEDVTRAWYSTTTAKHPSVGVTQPQYSGPTPPYDFLDTSGKYSWGKAPRYGGAVMEVGPLARMLVAYAAGSPQARRLVDGALSTIGMPLPAMFSTIGRMVARALETKWLAGQLLPWIDELQSNINRGDLTVANNARWSPSSWPARSSGAGFTEAPRGALGHWVRITEDKIANYQIVIPSTWNGSPRDAKGQRGAWEQALMGVQVHDAAQPLEIVRVIHSFDPCMACAVHVLDATGGELAHVTVVP
jgi:hydrogenase large subunit